MDAIIPAAGLASRMRGMPKFLLPAVVILGVVVFQSLFIVYLINEQIVSFINRGVS